jgi:TadE-like protein
VSAEAEASRGSVTAEFAVLLPGLVFLLAAVLAAGSAAVAQVRCVDAARSAARLAARHESGSVVVQAGRAAGPAGSSVRVSAGSQLVRVRVSAEVALPLPGRPRLAVGAMSTARLEAPPAQGPVLAGSAP